MVRTSLPKSPEVSALLFDLGGVLLDIDWRRVFLEWSRYSPLSAAEIAARFQMDWAYREHECGHMSAHDYFAYLKQKVEYEGDERSFVLGWNSIFVGPITDTVDLLDTLGRRFPLYLLTNTNATHEAQWRTAYASIIGRFERVFVSSTMGHRKPDRKAFEHVLGETGRAAATVLFFDDTHENVEGARAAGLQAVQVAEPVDITRALAERAA